jgi:protein ImuB
VEACDGQGRLAQSGLVGDRLALPAVLADGSDQEAVGADAPAPEAALALVGRAGRRRVVRSVDLVARKAGLCPGTLVAKAQALYPDLTIMDADPQGTARGWKNWPCGSSAAWLLSCVDPPDGIVLDTTGADHLHGGEQAMLAAMVQRLRRTGVTAKAAVADSFGAAHALARYGRARMLVAPRRGGRRDGGSAHRGTAPAR